MYHWLAQVGFPRRDPDKLRLALENTYALVWVRATKPSRLARQGQLIGFARATSDGALSATIWDVAVNPAWQVSACVGYACIWLGVGVGVRVVAEVVDVACERRLNAHAHVPCGDDILGYGRKG